MQKVVEGVFKASMMINPTLYKIKRKRPRTRSTNYEPTNQGNRIFVFKFSSKQINW